MTHTASAAVITYYWEPSSGPIGSSGFTANWGNCGNQPESYKVTALRTGGFNCNYDRIDVSSSGAVFLAISPSPYTGDTHITGQAGARFYLRNSYRSDANYLFELGYATGGAFTPMGSVTQKVPRYQSGLYVIDMSTINGEAPANSHLALKVSVSRGNQRIELGSNRNSGRFSVDETVSTPEPPEPPIPPIPPAPGSKKLLISTNRQTILDDPGSTALGQSPRTNYDWNSDYWKGESTTIRAKLMVLDSKGHPISGETVTVRIFDSRNTMVSGSSVVVTTNANGMASYSFNLNGYEDTDIGTFRVEATGSGISASKTFNYDFWGCGDCHGEKGIDSQDSFNAVSPYLGTYAIHGYSTYEHGKSDSRNLISGRDCSGCHRRYGPNAQDTEMTDKDLLRIASDSGTQTTYGLHEDKKYCQDCHTIGHKDNQIGAANAIKECDNSACHNQNNNHITMNYDFVSGTPGSGGKYRYSTTLMAHQPTPTISCILCHQQMHNITKPDPSAGTSNSYTEESQCLSCHTEQGKHSSSNPVYCTACHSQDAHIIKVLGTDGNYYNRGTGNAITASISDCRDCHSTGGAATFFGTLAGMDAYSVNFDPVGKFNSIHFNQDCSSSCHDTTDFHTIGEGGGGPDCLSCHNSSGSTTHRVDGAAISGGIHAGLNSEVVTDVNPENKKCWGCHQSDGTEPAANSMGDIYQTPWKCDDCHLLSGIKNGSYGAYIVDEHYPDGTDIKALTGYNLDACIQCHNKTQMKVDYTSPDDLFTNYSLVSHYGRKRTDMILVNTNTNCSYCHQDTSEFVDIFMDVNNIVITHDGGQPCSTCHGDGRIHNSTLVGGGGRDCVTCHNGDGRARVDVASMRDDYIHYGLNSESNTGELDSANRMCWACHTEFNGTVSVTDLPESGHPAGYDTPKSCMDCHIGTVKFNAPLISEHNPDADQLTTTFTCVQCHNNSIRPFTDSQTNLSTNMDTADPDFNIGKVSHYANTNDLVSDGLVISYVYCEKCHNNADNATKYGLGRFNVRHDQKSCLETACHRSDSGPVSNLHDIDLEIEILNFEDIFYPAISTNYCTSCHSNSLERPLGYHGTESEPVKCNVCHMNASVNVTARTISPRTNVYINTVYHTDNGTISYTYNGLAPGDNSYPYGSLEYNRSRCNVCHDGADETHGTGFDCIECHSSNNERPVWHSNDIKGGGGRDCINCHNGSGRARVDVPSMNESDYIHDQLNNNSNTGTLDSANRMCWACHTNNTFTDIVNYFDLPEDGHPDGYNTPRTCTECHRGETRFSAPVISEHNPDADGPYELTTTFTCVQCHNNSIRPFSDSQTNLSTNMDMTNPDFNIGKISHYANTNDLVTDGLAISYVYCEKCHNDANNATKYGLTKLNARHDQKSCLETACHRSYSGPVSNLHDIDLKIEILDFEDIFYPGVTTNYCTGCHSNSPARPFGYHGTSTTKVKCNVCHLNASIDLIAKTISPRTNVYINTVYHTDNGTNSYTYNGLGPGNNSYPYGSLDYNRSRCNVCHNAANETHNPGSDCIACHFDKNNPNLPTWHSDDITGGAGPDCVLCHDIGGPGPNVNITSLKEGVHDGLNSGASNDTALTDLVDKACWACHGDGSEPTGHPENYTNPKKCIDCHNATQAALLGLSGYSAPEVREHVPEHFEDIQTSASCMDCHVNDIGDTTGSQDGTIVKANLSANVSHYAQNDSLMTPVNTSKDCMYCHADAANNGTWGGAPLITTVSNPGTSHTGKASTTNVECYLCHGGEPANLHDATLNAGAGGECIDCHSAEGMKTLESRRNAKINLYINRTAYDTSKHGAKDCVDCHIDNRDPSQVNTHGNLNDTLRGSVLSTPIPARTAYDNQNYALCFTCHSEQNITGAPAGYKISVAMANFPFPSLAAPGTNFRNENPAGFFSLYPVNIHWDHINIGLSMDTTDSNRDGVFDSMPSCVTCHDPHGQTVYPNLTRSDLGIIHGSDIGAYGQIGKYNFTEPGGDMYCAGMCHLGPLEAQKYYREII